MLIDKIKKTADKFGLLEKGDPVLVAVSGGPDSTALLLALNALKYDYKFRLHIAHFDHMFRSSEETSKDYEYVSALAKQLKLPLIFGRSDVPKYAKETGLSLEEAAREKRYEFLLKAAEDSGAKKIALGHTIDDQAETILMRLIRGAGLSGLRGIPPSRRINGFLIVRPLIESWRKEVESYLRGMKIEPRQDITNLMSKFLRNRIRHELMLLLEKYNPSIKLGLARTAQSLTYDYEVLSDLVNKEFPKCAKIKNSSVEINLPVFLDEKTGLRRGMLRKAIETVKGDLRRIDYSHIEEIESLLSADKGALDLPDKIRATKTKDLLLLSRIAGAQPAVPKIWRQLSVPGRTLIPELKLSFEAKFVKTGLEFGKPKNVEYLDYDRIKGDLHVKTRDKGDRFRPLGMSRDKKLQDFFVDEKVSRSQRNLVPIVVSGNKIIWVCGLRLSDEVKITSDSKRILKLSYKRSKS